jgi:hypothetical protein
VFSVFAKKAELGYLYLGYENNVPSEGVFFNLNDGTISQNTSGLTANIEDFGNGWYRCSVNLVNKTNHFISPSANGTSFALTNQQNNGIYIWGAQAEAGSYATSYIPTTSASVTRNADVISKTGISSLIGQTEGTMFFDIVFPQNTTPSYIGISDGATSNRLILGCEFGTFFTFGYGYSTLPLSINTPYKIALAYNSTNMKIYANGSLIATVLGSVPSGMNRFAFDSGGNTQHLIASVKSAALWKTKLSDTQLAQLTTL